VIDNRVSGAVHQVAVLFQATWAWAVAHAALTVAVLAASVALVWLVEQAILRARIARRKR
jgi:hypothetical protein